MFRILLLLSLVGAPLAAAPAQEGPRCLSVEFYIDGSQESQRAAAADLEKYAQRCGGIQFRILDVEDAAQAERLERICRHFSLEKETPLLYGCGRALVKAKDDPERRRQLDRVRTLTTYTRPGCPRCASAKEYLKTFSRKYPGVLLNMVDITASSEASRELQALLAAHRTTAASVPVFHICDQVIVGYLDDASSGSRLDSAMRRWSTPCKPPAAPPGAAPAKGATGALLRAPAFPALAALLLMQEPAESADQDLLPLPGEQDPPPLPEEDPPESSSAIDLPLIGKVDAARLGLPLFTIAVGLVDGFNPCAMWVLVFLLSVLVNLHHRGKILAVAGTFVFVSAAFYFAFMAAWINVFQFIGMTRAMQVTLGLLALLVGAIHVKDFFAFKQGVSLSIPESAKPKIYERVRRIVNAENLFGAIVGAAILAALVNMVELLCTAGLPALYTQVLFAQELPAWNNYAYLLLYNLAYMFDDGLMVAVVVVTLGKGKMQETHGRWLKLVSGLAILILGLLMLVRPQWLGM